MKAGKGVVRDGDGRAGFCESEIRAFRSRSGLALLRRMAMLGVALCLADSVWAELTRPDLSRYEVIITRRPFGETRLEPKRDAVQEKAVPPAFTLKLTLCGFTVDGDETRVGFLDKEKNPPVSYYLQVGQEQGEFKVISADYDGGTVLLEKDGRQETLRMVDGLAGTPKSAPAVGVPRPGAAVARGASLAERIEQRRLEVQEKRATPPVGGGRSATTVTTPVPASNPGPLPPPLDPAAAAAMEKKTREYNMELIRRRAEIGPPLPIQLTEEEDVQLVSEGVLEPRQ